MIKQIAVFVENQKGSFRRVAAALRKQNIGICALSTVDSPEFGIFRMIVDAPEAAAELLPRLGFVAKESEVIAVKLAFAAELEKLLQVIEDGNVNINYFYTSFGRDGVDPVLILHADDMDETEEMLRGNGFRCLDQISG